MAEYDYVSGGYTTSYGIGSRTDYYNRGAGTGTGTGFVTADGQGRSMRPIIGFTDSYASKPFVEKTEYQQYISPANNWGRQSSPIHDQPYKVEDYATRVSPISSTNWHPNPYTYTGHNGTGGYGEYSDYSKKDYWNNSSGSTIRNDRFDDYYNKNDGWGRTNGPGWAATSESSLTKPTSNIGLAVETLKDAAGVPSSSPHGGFSTPVSTVPKYGESIDTMDATRRYGNFNLTSRPRERKYYT